MPLLPCGARSRQRPIPGAASAHVTQPAYPEGKTSCRNSGYGIPNSSSCLLQAGDWCKIRRAHLCPAEPHSISARQDSRQFLSVPVPCGSGTAAHRSQDPIYSKYYPDYPRPTWKNRHASSLLPPRWYPAKKQVLPVPCTGRFQAYSSYFQVT